MVEKSKKQWKEFADTDKLTGLINHSDISKFSYILIIKWR